MSKSLQAIRGMNDILPDQSPLWRYFEGTVAGLLDTYGYSQIRTPIVEFTELFKRSIGEVTDIVEKRCTPSRTATAIRSPCVLKALPPACAPSSSTASPATARCRSCGTWARCSAMSARKGPLPPVSPDRCRGVQPRRAGRRCRADHADLAPVGPAGHPGRGQARTQQPGHQRGPCPLPRSAGRIPVGTSRATG